MVTSLNQVAPSAAHRQAGQCTLRLEAMNSLGAPSESPSTLEDSDGVPDGPDVSVFASAMLPCGRVVPNRLVKVRFPLST
jgi:hypothetical protein